MFVISNHVPIGGKENNEIIMKIFTPAFKKCFPDVIMTIDDRKFFKYNFPII